MVNKSEKQGRLYNPTIIGLLIVIVVVRIAVSYPTGLYGHGTDNVGRQFVMELQPGDTITVDHQQTDQATGLLRNVVFCVTSLPFNVE